MGSMTFDNGSSGIGLAGESFAVWGDTNTGAGVIGTSSGAFGSGVLGKCSSGPGVLGVSDTPNAPGVQGISNSGTGPGVEGDSESGPGVRGTSRGRNSAAVLGSNTGNTGVGAGNAFGAGVAGISTSGTGVYGRSDYVRPPDISLFEQPGPGVFGEALSGIGVYGRSNAGTGVLGYGDLGVYARSDTGDGILAGSEVNGFGVHAYSNFGTAVGAFGGNVGVFARNSLPPAGGNDAYLGTVNFAGDFHGDVSILGNLFKHGGGFRIDHPLDAARKYLSHSFVESPDMKNIYDGVVVLDTSGEAEVELPTWFETLNTDYRYQLTCIGGYAPVYIAQEVQDNRFKIAGGRFGMKVSWQISGIRQDAWASAHRIPVEEEKPAEEHGHYLHPELHGVSNEKHIRRVRYPEQRGHDIFSSHFPAKQEKIHE